MLSPPSTRCGDAELASPSTPQWAAKPHAPAEEELEAFKASALLASHAESNAVPGAAGRTRPDQANLLWFTVQGAWGCSCFSVCFGGGMRDVSSFGTDLARSAHVVLSQTGRPVELQWLG